MVHTCVEPAAALPTDWLKGPWPGAQALQGLALALLWLYLALRDNEIVTPPPATSLSKYSGPQNSLSPSLQPESVLLFPAAVPMICAPLGLWGCGQSSMCRQGCLHKCVQGLSQCRKELGQRGRVGQAQAKALCLHTCSGPCEY